MFADRNTDSLTKNEIKKTTGGNEMMGYIKMHRKLVDWEWYTDPNVSRVFIHLLLTASYRTRSWRNINIHRGQCITSANRLASELGLGRQAIRTALKKLQATNEITIKATKEGSVITLCNYARYNESETTFNQPDLFDINQPAGLTNHQPTSNQPCPTNLESHATLTVRGIGAASAEIATNHQPSSDTVELTTVQEVQEKKSSEVSLNGTELPKENEERERVNAELDQAHSRHMEVLNRKESAPQVFFSVPEVSADRNGKASHHSPPTDLTRDQIDQIERIRRAYPKRGSETEIQRLLVDSIRKGQNLDEIEAKTKRFADLLEAQDSPEAAHWIASAYDWFADEKWSESEMIWKSRWVRNSEKTGRKRSARTAPLPKDLKNSTW